MRKITWQHLLNYEAYLRQEERSSGTIEKYLRDVKRFAAWAESQEEKDERNEENEGKKPAGAQAAKVMKEPAREVTKVMTATAGEVTKELAATWKLSLIEQGYRPVTVNSMVAAVNSFFRFMGWEDCRIRFLRVQKQSFRRKERELTRADYDKLLAAADKRGDEQLRLLMEAICATGIRVSEVKYLTVEAARAGRAEVSMKGKIRVILLPARLCKKLLKYAQKEKITAGEIFLTGSGKSLSRKQIWAAMKALCKDAGVEASRVFPHNLRHLFARTFYRVCRDMARLADLLGHSSMDTTRIYLATTEAEQKKELNRLRLVT